MSRSKQSLYERIKKRIIAKFTVGIFYKINLFDRTNQDYVDGKKIVQSKNEARFHLMDGK